MRDLHREAWGSRGSGVQVIFVSEIARSATVLHQPLIEPDDVKWRANAFVRMDDDVSQFGTHTPRKKLVCTENSNSDIMVMQSAKDRVGMDTSSSLNWARERRVLI
jgi:hypothetical protein